MIQTVTPALFPSTGGPTGVDEPASCPQEARLTNRFHEGEHMPLIAVLPGDGIGPDVMEAALPVVAAAAGSAGLTLEFQRALVGGAAYDATGHPLPPATT